MHAKRPKLTINTAIPTLALLAFFALLYLTYPEVGSPDYVKAMIVIWGLTIVLGAALIAITVSFVAKVPRNELDRNGLILVTLFVTKYWKWSEVGPFWYSGIRASGTTIYSVCAFTNRNFDLLVSHGDPRLATGMDADITFALSGLPAGRNEESVLQFVLYLNAWREKFGRPDINVSAIGTRTEFQELQRKLSYKRTLNRILFVAVFVGLVCFAYYLNN